MPDPDARARPEDPAVPNRVTQTLRRWILRPARVAAVSTLSPHFRMIDLEGDGLKDVAWSPGQKIQVAIGSGLSSRTYTPMSWEADTGRTRLLAFLHGNGPGSEWAKNLRDDDTCQFLGPRRSLDLSGRDAPIVLFGDETSFGVAAALDNGGRAANAIYVFEVSDAAESRAVLEWIGLARASVTERRDGDLHLGLIGTDLLRHAAGGAHLVLTGKAQSIQTVSQALKKGGLTSSSMTSKAYWSPGKTGLD